MPEVEWFEREARLEVRSPMRVGMRVVFALVGLFPLIAPYEPLVRTQWTTYLHPFFALAAVISLGATALSAFLFFAAWPLRARGWCSMGARDRPRVALPCGMATDPGFAAFVVEQASDAAATSGDVRVRRMFGEYALYLGDKVVGLLCDDQAFLKPTAGGRALLEQVVEAPPYPGATPYLLLAEELDDRALLAALLQRTAAELPEPKPKKPKKAKAKRPRR